MYCFVIARSVCDNSVLEMISWLHDNTLHKFTFNLNLNFKQKQAREWKYNEKKTLIGQRTVGAERHQLHLNLNDINIISRHALRRLVLNFISFCMRFPMKWETCQLYTIQFVRRTQNDVQNDTVLDVKWS